MTTVESGRGSGSQASTLRKRKRIEPLKAWRAMRALIADHEDTIQVFKVIDALAGDADDRMYRRFASTATGQKILAEKLDLIETLSDSNRLGCLPKGTLGREYHDFMAEEGLTADGLVEASEVIKDRFNRDANARIFSDRMRDSHDLWHVTTGYGRDGLGELAQLAFYYAQTRNRGIGFIVLMGAFTGMKEAPKVGVWKAVREGYRLGKRAKWFPAADWEALLDQPIAEVRQQLGMGEPATYRAIEPIISAFTEKALRGARMKAV